MSSRPYGNTRHKRSRRSRSEIRRIQGPGSFEGETVPSLYAYDVMMNGFDDGVLGGEDGNTSYTLIRGPFCDDSLREFSDGEYGTLNRAERKFIVKQAGCIVTFKDSGFVDVTWCEDEQELSNAWDELEREYQEAQGPEEDDITTTDYRRFYQNDELVLTVPDDESWVVAVREYMDKQQYWPNVWHVSDHGNVTLVNLSEE